MSNPALTHAASYCWRTTSLYGGLWGVRAPAPATTANGDVVTVVAVDPGTATLTAPSGFTSVGTVTHGSGGRLTVWKKALTGAEPANTFYAVTVPANTATQIALAVIRAAAATGGPTLTSTTATGTSVASPSAAGGQTTTSQAVVVGALHADKGPEGRWYRTASSAWAGTNITDPAVTNASVHVDLVATPTSGTFPAKTVSIVQTAGAGAIWDYFPTSARLIAASLVFTG